MNKTTTADQTGVTILPEPGVQLPALATETFAKKGDFINRDSFSPEQNAQVAEMVEMFDIKDSSAVLQFGAPTQRRASAYMDELLGTMKVGEAGVAGSILTEITTGINMLQLVEVQKQLEKPRSWWQKLLGYKNYVHAFIDGHRTVVGKFDQIERQALNLMSTLSADSDKLDKLVASTVVQVGELRVLIAVGEDVLVAANADYATQVQVALAKEPRDTLELQLLQDYLDSIRSFEVRLLRIKTAFVESATVVVKEIRSAQRSIKIEIQNLDESVQYDITAFKRAVIQLGAQKNLQDAKAAREGTSQAVSDVRKVLGETTAANHAAAVESQGDAYRQVKEVIELQSKVLESSKKAMLLENEAAAQRREAAEMLEREMLAWGDSVADMAEQAVQTA